MYAEGRLKDQVVTKSKKGICSFPELKGSAFKPFRGLEMNVVHDILLKVSSRECSFKEATTKCNDIKALQKIQTAFIKATNCESWDEAMEKYPTFTTAEKLEPFKNLDFSNYKKIPEKFFNYCQHVKEVMNEPKIVINEDHDKHFFISHQNSLGLLWKTSMSDIHPSNAESLMKTANISRCSGFHLSLLDLVDDDEVCVCVYFYMNVYVAT